MSQIKPHEFSNTRHASRLGRTWQSVGQNYQMAPTYQWSPLIIAHAAAATCALVIGCILLFRRKGNFSHRTLGCIWVVLMGFVALASFGIKRDGFSWIHGMSVFTLIMLVVGVRVARAHNAEQHGKTMKGIYVCALIVTGLFTLLPSRLIGHALFGGTI